MRGKRLSSKTIDSVIDLYKAGHSSREICELKGLSKKSVLKLAKNYRIANEGKFTIPKARPGKPKVLSASTLSILNRQVKDKPDITARELKEQNS